LALEELVLEFDPVQTQSVQRALKQVHAHEHAEGSTHENKEAQVHLDDGAIVEPTIQAVVKENLCQLGVGERQSPETQVRSSIRNCAKDELNRFNQLVDHDLSEVVVHSDLGACTGNDEFSHREFSFHLVENVLANQFLRLVNIENIAVSGISLVKDLLSLFFISDEKLLGTDRIFRLGRWQR